MMKDNKYKRALIVCLGKYYDVAASPVDIKKIDYWLDEIDEILNNMEEINDVKIKELTVKHIVDLVRIRQILDKIEYETNIASELWKIMKVYGLVMGLMELWRKEDFEWDIVSEYVLYEYRMDELKEGGYEVWFWGY